MRRILAALFGASLLLPITAAPATAAPTRQLAASDCGGCQVQWDESNANRAAATFFVPRTVPGSGNVSIWVAVEGWGGSLVQVGINIFPGGSEAFWQEWEPSGPLASQNGYYGAFNMAGGDTPLPGDLIHVAVVPLKNGAWSMRYWNQTDGYANWVNGDNLVVPIKHPTAAWAVEDPDYGQGPLANFGQTAFYQAWPAMHAQGAGLEQPGGCMTTFGHLGVRYLGSAC